MPVELMNKTPGVSVVVVTKNEAPRIERCLGALSAFDDVWVVDTGGCSKTREIAENAGAQFFDFVWNGQYPKKRQWCLENLALKYEWVFFVDADEILTASLKHELAHLDFADDMAGYFVSGRYAMEGKILRFGLRNNKICLFHKGRMGFPELDDLKLPGMGEIEGHYQPVLKPDFASGKIGALKNSLLHDAFENWEARHKNYALWERGMNEGDLWPRDPDAFRQGLKVLFRALPFRPQIAFLHCYILKLGILDGVAGYRFALSRYRYYAMILSSSTVPG